MTESSQQIAQDPETVVVMEPLSSQVHYWLDFVGMSRLFGITTCCFTLVLAKTGGIK